MNARAALGCMQNQASLGLRVVGDLSAAIGIDCGIGFASGYHLDSTRPEQRPKTHAQRQSDGLFELTVGEAAAGVVAAVGRIEHHDKPGWRGRGSWRGLLRGNREGQECRCNRKRTKGRMISRKKWPNCEPDRQKPTPLLERPDAALQDRRVHRVRSKVQFAGPRHSAIIQRDLREKGRIGQRGEYPGLRRMYQAAEIDRTSKAIGKRDPQPEPRKGFNLGYTPRRPGRDLRS